MTIVQVINDQIKEVPIGASIQFEGVQHPWQVTELWSDADLAAINVFRVPEPTIPEGKMATGEYWFQWDGDRVVKVFDLVDIPVEPEPAPIPIVVAASSAKLVLDDDGLYQQVEDICRNHPVRAVRIFWESANTWSEDNPYVQAIGVELGLSDETVHAMFERALLK